MQKASECWETSSCHSFCSTNERHFRDYDINDEELDFEADHPAEAALSQSKDPPRPKKDSREREALLADATAAETEEGEIKDSSSVGSAVDDTHPCRFFEKGFCAYGDGCRFLHHTDKGLYRMFDRPRLPSRKTHNRRRLPVKPEPPPFPVVSPEEGVPDWDQELKDAMLRVGMSKKVVPFFELSLTFKKKTKAIPTTPSKTFARRVRYLGDGEEETRLPGLLTSKRKNCRAPPSKSSRNNKRRYSDSSHSRSRSLSVGRRFSCKCCRTPSPKPRSRHASSSRRPICCYRRKSVSESSSSSSSPVPRRRARNVADDWRRDRRGRSCANSPHKTKIQQNIGTSKASTARGSGTASMSARKRRNSKTFASPKSNVEKCGSDKNIFPTSHSSAEVDKFPASYSPDRRLSDMSISPLSSDSNNENDPDVRFSSIRRPSDMSISPFSHSPSPVRFSVPAWRADEPTCGIAVPNQLADPRKVPKSVVSATRKKLKSDIAESYPHIVLPQVPMYKSTTPKEKRKSEVAVPKPSVVPPKVQKSIGSDSKTVRKYNVVEPKPSVMPSEISKSVNLNPKMMLKKVAEPKLPVQQEVPKSIDSALKKGLKSDVAQPKPSGVPQEMPKPVDCIPKKVLKNDVAEPKVPAVPKEMSKSKSSVPKKRFNHLMFDLMKFHRKECSTEVAIKTKAVHSLKREEVPTKKINQIPANYPTVLSKKEFLLKQLQEVNAAIERKKALAKQNP